MSSERACLLQAQALSCQRGGRLVCHLPDLRIQAGDLLWLRGPNGAGKTSLLRVLAGVAQPAAGVVRPSPEARVLYLGHQQPLKDELSVEENLAFLAELNGLDGRGETLSAALQQWGLLARRHRAVRTLSQGQRRRLSLARLSLGARRRLWLLDEPFDALDTEGVGLLARTLGEHQSAGGAALLTGHGDWPQDGLQVQAVWLTAPLPNRRQEAA
jgi:heme exporter protein A